MKNLTLLYLVLNELLSFPWGSFASNLMPALDSVEGPEGPWAWFAESSTSPVGVLL